MCGLAVGDPRNAVGELTAWTALHWDHRPRTFGLAVRRVAPKLLPR